ncbi:hypothetical protein LUU34_00632500 [Aix galericulata]|nr:hypothetical protein LUU34_00632500 [Aix galericulata]
MAMVPLDCSRSTLNNHNLAGKKEKELGSKSSMSNEEEAKSDSHQVRDASTVPCAQHCPPCHSPVWLSAVSDAGFPTTRQPGSEASPSCLMPHCIHSTSSAAGFSHSTSPFLPDTAARKAHGEGRPEEKRHQRDSCPCLLPLPCTSWVLRLAPFPIPSQLTPFSLPSPYLHFSSNRSTRCFQLHDTEKNQHDGHYSNTSTPRRTAATAALLITTKREGAALTTRPFVSESATFVPTSTVEVAAAVASSESEDDILHFVVVHIFYGKKLESGVLNSQPRTIRSQPKC